MHVVQGYTLMNEWSIPHVYCDVAKHHHDEEFDSSDSLLMAVRLVNRVCAKTGLSLNPDPSLVMAAMPEVQALSVKELVLAELEIVIEDSLEAE
jgi:HD-like signal output (HDOD) protein